MILFPSFDQTRFAVYIHWPFCESKCPYCDFNSHVRESIDHQAWENAYLLEVQHCFEQCCNFPPEHPTIKRHTISSVFFGGGTPSLMSPRTILALLKALDDRWGLSNDCEITMEANPSSVEVMKLRDFQAAGVNRLSLGIQSLRPENLHFLGRKHDVRQALDALDVASVTFPRFSFDLIHSLPIQTLDQWVDDLEFAMGLAGDHMSLYALTIEPHTAFARQVARGDWIPKSDDEIYDFLKTTESVMASKNFFPYEISNFAKMSDGQCRHNLTYWRYQPYLGIGPGAHGRYKIDDTLTATTNIKLPETWIRSVTQHGHGLSDRTALDTPLQQQEMILMGLRLTEGLNEDHVQQVLGVGIDEIIPQNRIDAMIEAHWMGWDKNTKRLYLTAEGRLRCDGITRYLLS